MDLISEGYLQCMREKHEVDPESKAPAWGQTGHRYAGKWVRGIIEEYDIKTALDYGCGKGTLSGFLPQVEWTNYDPGVEEFSTFPTGQFDMVVSSDVLEHIEPPYLDNVLDAMRSLTRDVLAADIPTEPTGNKLHTGPYRGSDEHLTVERAEWWAERFKHHDFEMIYARNEPVTLRYANGTPKPGPKRVRARLLFRRGVR